MKDWGQYESYSGTFMLLSQPSREGFTRVLHSGRSPDSGFILLARLPIPSLLGQWQIERSSSFTVAGQWRILTALPVTGMIKDQLSKTINNSI